MIIIHSSFISNKLKLYTFFRLEIETLFQVPFSDIDLSGPHQTHTLYLPLRAFTVWKGVGPTSLECVERATHDGPLRLLDLQSF